MLARLASKKKGERRARFGNGEARASAFVGQFYPLQGLFHQKNWTTTVVGIPNLIVVTSLSITLHHIIKVRDEDYLCLKLPNSV
ncbi:hypothetical protein [Paenibacillus sp. IITD108]|uniref:hypothetical protein n=1 Tax=Paenibacillus sp. IITD108 TaxID=3116649 RepID=UPI002F4185B9